MDKLLEENDPQGYGVCFQVSILILMDKLLEVRCSANFSSGIQVSILILMDKLLEVHFCLLVAKKKQFQSLF